MFIFKQFSMWQPHAEIIAMTYNINKEKGKPAISGNDVNPYYKPEKRKIPKDTKLGFKLLKKHFYENKGK